MTKADPTPRRSNASVRPDSVPGRIAVLAFDGISPFHLSVPCLIFGEDRRDIGMPRFDLVVCSATPGPLRTSAGFMMETRHGLQALRSADVVIVPSWRLDKPVPALVRNAILAAHRHGATVVGLCLGAFVLAESGLLDGRSATTHWHWAESFSERFPRVRLDPAVLYIDEGRVVTSAGTVAAIDCCLYLLRRWCGAEIANRVAKRLVVSPHRRGGQAQFIEQAIPAPGREPRLQDLIAWMGKRLHERHTIDSLASRVAMSPRNFTRQFRMATGTTALRWLVHQRLALACRLLETTDRPVEMVATLSGFGSAISLRHHFSTVLGVSPGIYRRQFSAKSGQPGSPRRKSR